jgi:nucleotide-binding universal stress UspA family protein
VPLSEPGLVKTSLQAAFKAAGPFTAHIEALHVRPDPQLSAAAMTGEVMSSSMIDQIIKDGEKQSATNASKTREAFDRACKTAGIRYAEKPQRGNRVTAAWREETGYEDHELVLRGRASDLIVLSRPASAIDVAKRLSLEAALMETGRPLLLVPPKVPTKIGSNIAIAWNGSAEAARAVGEAKPFLLNARKVTILTAAERQGEDSNPAGLQSLLAWHGIKARIDKVRTRGDVGKALLGAAKRAGADLLVMGGYSHSRVRELVLGGVTRHVLSEATMPVFMIH